MKLPPLLPLFVLPVLVSGCETISYRLTPPPTEMGRLCIAQCAGVRETCLAREEQKARDERQDCERREERRLRQCLHDAGNDQERRKKCHKYSSGCWSSAQTENCEAAYRDCYAICGGRIERVVEKW